MVTIFILDYVNYDMYVLKTAGITTKKRIHEFKAVMRSR